MIRFANIKKKVSQSQRPSRTAELHVDSKIKEVVRPLRTRYNKEATILANKFLRQSISRLRMAFLYNRLCPIQSLVSARGISLSSANLRTCGAKRTDTWNDILIKASKHFNKILPTLMTIVQDSKYTYTVEELLLWIRARYYDDDTKTELRNWTTLNKLYHDRVFEQVRKLQYRPKPSMEMFCDYVFMRRYVTNYGTILDGYIGKSNVDIGYRSYLVLDQRFDLSIPDSWSVFVLPKAYKESIRTFAEEVQDARLCSIVTAGELIAKSLQE